MTPERSREGMLSVEQISMVRSLIEMIKADAEFAFEFSQRGETELALKRLVSAIQCITRALDALLPPDEQ